MSRSGEMERGTTPRTAAAIQFDDVALVGLNDLHDELGVGVALDQIGDGVDGASDELAFEDDDVGGVALQALCRLARVSACATTRISSSRAKTFLMPTR